MIDFDALTDEQRLDLIQFVLGLLPSADTREGRSIYLAFQIAQRSDAEAVEHAARELERVAPGWLSDRVLPFAKDIKGVEFPAKAVGRIDLTADEFMAGMAATPEDAAAVRADWEQHGEGALDGAGRRIPPCDPADLEKKRIG